MSRMKWSKSMSSLELPHNTRNMRTPDGLRKQHSPLTRLSTNSLNSKKPRRAFGRKMLRRSWGSEGGSQEELLKMSLLTNCQQGIASPKKFENESTLLEDFLQEYAKACQWLNEVQLERGRCAARGGLSELAGKLRAKRSIRSTITKRAKELAKLIPMSREEFAWRAKHLNSQWDALEKLLHCESSDDSATEKVPADNENELVDAKWLKDWIQKIERELRPLSFNIHWTSDLLDKELQRHKALQAEIDEKASTVHAILKQCQIEGSDANKIVGGSSCHLKQRRRAENLEGRWIQLRLRILEWIEHLSSLEIRIGKDEQENSQYKASGTLLATQIPCVEDSTEPLRKYPRLGDAHLSPAEKNFCISKGTLTFDPASVTDSPDFGSGFILLPNLELDISTEDRGELLLFDDTDDWMMGQSQEAESAYQSLSPVPNSVIEFTFDGSESIGMKRKLGPSLPSKHQNLLLQVVPTMSNKNISTYYFKHCENSDTEEQAMKNSQRTTISRKLSSESDHADGHGENKCFITRYNELNGTKFACQKSLDFSQEYEKLGKNRMIRKDDQFQGVSRTTDTENSDFGVVPIDLTMEDVEAKNLQNLNEIEELVQKVESLIKSSRSARPAAASVVRDRLVWDEMSEEEEGEDDDENVSNDELAQGASASFQKHQLTHKNGVATNVPRFSLQNMTTNANGFKNFNGSRIAKSKQMTVLNDKCRVRLPTKDEGAETGASSIAVMNGSENSEVGPSQISSRGKLVKKHARVRQWIRAHNNRTAEVIAEQKNTSSCDASAESASESDPGSDLQLSSDDPTTVCASAVQRLQSGAAVCRDGQLFFKRGGSSSNTVNKLSPSASSSGGVFGAVNAGGVGVVDGANGIVWRAKKRHAFVKQRPKSFTDTFSCNNPIASTSSQRFGPSSSRHTAEYFVSDTALNFLGHQSGSGSSSPGQSLREASSSIGKKRHFKRKLFRNKKRSFDYSEMNEDNELDGLMRSTSFSGALRLENQEMHNDEKENESGPSSSKQHLSRLNSDNASVNTEELPSNEQDWDSYQEKYLSEPYSEELYDQDRTLKLLAFGEDYDQVLDRADSESSSLFSGFESNPRTRRPLVLKNRNEMQESDSDREELNHFLAQSRSQLHYLDIVFKKQLSLFGQSETNSEFSEMNATCEENINSLQLVLSNLENPEHFGIDKTSVEGVLEQWKLLKEKITQAVKLQELQEETNALRGELDNFAFNLGQVDPFDVNDLSSLVHKIGVIQEILVELGCKRERLQTLNESSLGSQLFLKESHVAEQIKMQMQELYALYEENYQLGSYLLSKMKYLQSAWEDFEAERIEFEKSLNNGNGVYHKSKRDLSSSASTDSGHGTDFSHDSSISDSDVEFKEKKQKLVALKKRASDLHSFIPPGSPVLDIIDKKISDVQRDFETLRKLGHFEPVDLKIIYPKKRSPPTSRRTSAKSSPRASPTFEKSKSPKPQRKLPGRKWRILRLSLTFHLALMGLFAVAWFLQPRCCENQNTFCFSLVPHLSHEKMPHM